MNTVLCFVVAFLGFKDYETWNRAGVPLPHKGIMAQKTEIENGNATLTVLSKEPISKEAYNLISEKNIFSPERKEYLIPPVAAVAEAAKPVVRPQIVLYGVAIAEDYESATIVNSGRALQKGERETLIVKVGEQIEGYKVTKILSDRIALESNGETFEVLLNDKNAKKRMQLRTETKPVMTSNAQTTQESPSAEAPQLASQESAEKPKQPGKTRVVSLPFNKYTYQFLGSSAASAVISRGKIIYNSPLPQATN